MKLSGNDLNKIESVGFKNLPMITFLQESDVTTANISQSFPHVMAGKHLAYIRYEEIASLSPYVFNR